MTSAQLPVYGVVLAAGAGLRSGLDYPKQFLRLGGLPVLEHTLRVFEDHAGVDGILVIASTDWLEETEQLVLDAGCAKVRAVVPGGITRNESTRAALDYLADGSDCFLVIHDAVRPLLSSDIIDRCLLALAECDAVDVVIETADTIVEVEGERVRSIPDRSSLRRGQTPQCFRLSVLSDAYRRVEPSALARFTDDCAVVLAADPSVEIKVVAGSSENIKITQPIDIYLADRLLQAKQTLVPHRDIKALEGSVVAIIGGSSGIGEAIVEAARSIGALAVSLSRTERRVDVRVPVSIQAGLDSVAREFGRIDAVINSAGVLVRGDVVELDEAELKSAMDINLMGPLYVARASYPHLKSSRGHLVLFTSSSYTRGRQGYAVYSAAKAGVVNLTQALADEWLGSGVKVNCINPGRTNTPMRRNAFGVEPPHSLMDPHEVAMQTLAVLTTTMTGHVFDIQRSGLPS